MDLKQLVVKDAIVPALKARERDDVIAELIDALVAAEAVDAALRDELVETLIAREKSGSTGLGKGVGVPHIRHAALNKMVATIGVSALGVDFNALDRQPVYTIFLLLSPEDKHDDHLHAMETIVGNLQNETFRRFLRQAETPDDVESLLEEADAKSLPA